MRSLRRALTALCLASAGCNGGAGGDMGADDDDDSGGTSVPEGLGCDAPRSCDRGEFVGSLRITTPEDMEMIAGYTSLSGWLDVFETDAECLDFLGCMEDVGRDLTVFGNARLTSTAGLDGLRNLGTMDDGNLIFGSNDALTDFDGANGLETIPGSLSIRNHEQLERISGLTALETIGIDIAVQQNPALADLSGLHELQQVLGRFIVTQNPELCISEIERVGADLAAGPDGGSTASNKGC